MTMYFVNFLFVPYVFVCLLVCTLCVFDGVDKMFTKTLCTYIEQSCNGFVVEWGVCMMP